VQVRFADGTAAADRSPADPVRFHEIGADDVVIHDLENLGETTIRFTTVELLA
jgi:hypothetical protein